MADNTIIQQGRFISTGATETLSIRSNFDWMKVYNETAMYSASADTDLGAEFYYQNGMTVGRGVVYIKINSGDDAAQPITIRQIAEGEGFTPVDSSGNPLGSAVAVTGATTAVRPVYATGSTAGLFDGTIVRLYGTTGQRDLAGMDWSIDTIMDDTSFRIAPALANAPGAVATAGFYRIVKFDPLFYPRHRFIVDIQSVDNTTVITLSVPSGYVEGQEVRVSVLDPFYGMPQINGLVGTITDVDDTLGIQEITLDIDSSAFDAFTFPTSAQAAARAYNRAMVVPVGENTGFALTNGQDILSDAMVNEGFIGVRLGAGDLAPAGNEDDIIYWVAGKSFSVNNE